MQCNIKALSLCFALTTLFCPVIYGGRQPHESILVQDNSGFAMGLYQKLCTSDGNIFFSPYSISTALAMTYAGARGNTEKEMAKTLRFSLDQEHLHPAFALLTSGINQLQESGNIQLDAANTLWPQQDYKFLDEYLSLVKKYYGVSITAVDYKDACEAARKLINKWVEEKTRDKIKDLVQPGMLNELTRLVLVNAVYFKGRWESRFNDDKTKDALFYTSLKKSVQASLMAQKEKFGYADLGFFEMLELPYAGNKVSMMLLLPKKRDGLAQVEAGLSAENLKQWESQLRKQDVRVFLPKFRMTSMFRLDKALMSMGMVDAFNDSRADFSGMDGRSGWLYIGAVIHKAFADVNEEGTEAAAATAVVMRAKSLMPAPHIVFRADHPFVFLIRENATGSILFMGRLTDPSVTEE